MKKTKCVQLETKTDPTWVRVILDNFDAFLADHADCERKAFSNAMGLIAKYPERKEIVGPLIDFAMEELMHFRQVYRLMEKRGIPMPTASHKDPYVNALMIHCRHGRDENFLDRLLISSIVEARGAERFRIVCRALPDASLKKLYRGFYQAEARHGNFFVNLLGMYFSENVIDDRLKILVHEESKIIQNLPWRPSLH